MPTRSTILLVSVFSLSYLVCITEQQLTDPSNTTIPADNSTSSGLSHAASLFYGLLATTVTNLAALLGFVFTSAHRFSCYPVLISFMVAVAVGSLFSTAILVLIPEAFGLVNDPNYRHTYVPAAITVCVGAFVFFLLEFLLRRFRTIIAFCSGRQTSRSLTASCELRQVTSGDLEVVTPATVPIVNGGPQSKVNMSGHDHHSIKSFKSFDGTEPIRLCGPDTCQRIAHLDPVVWMIVIGDGMHNLMDGLSIGTGFASDWRLGLSLSLAILCEELPHELGTIWSSSVYI